VAGVCQEIGLADYLDALAGPNEQQVSVGTATVAMILNGLGFSDDSPQLKPGASGMTLVCRPTPLVRLHPLGRALLTDPNTGWHLFQ